MDFISGPRIGSTPGNLTKGNTDSFTLTQRGATSAVKPCSASDVPAMQRAAIFASDTPMHLETNGTVRDARGFTSSTYTSSSCTASCTFISPTTPSSKAMARTWRRISSCTGVASRYGGSEQAESPE